MIPIERCLQMSKTELLKADTIWKPDVILYNNADRFPSSFAKNISDISEFFVYFPNILELSKMLQNSEPLEYFSEFCPKKRRVPRFPLFPTIVTC